MLERINVQQQACSDAAGPSSSTNIYDTVNVRRAAKGTALDCSEIKPLRTPSTDSEDDADV